VFLHSKFILIAISLLLVGSCQSQTRDFAQLNSLEWHMTNHDLHMTRSRLSSPDNVHLLQLEWIFNNTDDEPIENSPLVVGNVGYTQDNHMRVRAFDIRNDRTSPGSLTRLSALTLVSITTLTALHTTMKFSMYLLELEALMALSATEGTVIWETRVRSAHPGFRIRSIPSVWDYIIIGAALGDQPPTTTAAPFGSESHQSNHWRRDMD